MGRMTTPEIEERPAGALYRAFWRWHFYAGLMVMPVLMLMALTGGLYLFNDEIDGVLYRRLLHVPAAASATTPEAWAKAAMQAAPGRVAQVVPPAEPTRSAVVVVEAPSGERRAVYVDPHDARVLGSIPDGGLMQTVKRLHSLDLIGPIANLLIEVVAGWAIVMVATGVVLWWPRGQGGGVVTVRDRPRRRVFWRDLHAVTGAFAGGVIVFLAVTGMPWSQIWGEQVRAMTNEAGLGRPAPPKTPAHHEGGVPWALEGAEMPMDGQVTLSLDDAVARIDATGLPRPYVLSIPGEPGKAWSAAYMPDKVEATRTLYLGDGGQVVADIGYGDFGAAAKTIEWGIAVHQGQQFGRVNQFVMLAGCVAIWLLGISALVMWWKRRPKGRLAAPPRPADRRAYLALAAVVVPLAIFYPLVGASLLTVLVVEAAIRGFKRLQPSA